MLGDLSQLPPDRVVRTAVCIIGAGAAGITLARELSKRAIDTCLLEAGNFDFSAPVQQAICGGAFDGTLADTFPEYLTSSRLAYFGGTTNHWAGWCRELDPLDFEPRPWIGSAGWPIRRSELDSFYLRAAELIELSFSPAARSAVLRDAQAAMGKGLPSFEPGSFVISPPTRFGTRYRPELLDSEHVRLFLDSRVVGAQFADTAATADSAPIESIEVLHISGAKFRVAAKRFVLATGGIENARMLLNIADGSNGRGNAGDWVGRCFMDHPEVTIGLAQTELSPAAGQQFVARLPGGWSNRSLTTLYLSPSAQQREQLPNLSVQLTPVGPEVVPPDVREMFQAFGKLLDPQRALTLHLRVRLEPRANRDSRVVLTGDRDPAGQRKTRVSWRLQDVDAHACRKAAELFAKEFSSAASARIKLLIDEATPWRYVTFASHHVGTTRMSAKAGDGVVDANCTVFGIPNLSVAGSSVFPAAGVSNPTWTIVALALRLSDYLAVQLGAGHLGAGHLGTGHLVKGTQ